MNKQHRLEAIDWLSDIFPEDIEEIQSMTDKEIIEGINRYYQGGYTAYLLAIQ